MNTRPSPFCIFKGVSIQTRNSRWKLILSVLVAVGLAVVGGGETLSAQEVGNEGGPQCRVTGNVTLDVDADTPTRVAFVTTDEKCMLSVSYEILSVQEFQQLTADTPDAVEETLDPGNAPSSMDDADASRSPAGMVADESYVSASPWLSISGRSDTGTADAAALATKKIRGHHKACHFSCDWYGFPMTEVKAEFRWWYDGTYVTGWGEGLGTRVKYNDCWSFGSLFQVYWDTSQAYVRYGDISLWTKSTFTSNCPGASGGWLRVQAYGHYQGSKSVNCSRDFSGPWPTVYACWVSYI